MGQYGSVNRKVRLCDHVLSRERALREYLGLREDDEMLGPGEPVRIG